MTTYCVSGSRGINNVEEIDDILYDHLCLVNDKILVGDARGVDYCVREFCKDNDVFHQVFAAPWDEHGKAAGPIRNKQMVHLADELIAIWDGVSLGTQNAIMCAKHRRIPTHIYYL